MAQSFIPEFNFDHTEDLQSTLTPIPMIAEPYGGAGDTALNGAHEYEHEHEDEHREESIQYEEPPPPYRGPIARRMSSFSGSVAKTKSSLRLLSRNASSWSLRNASSWSLPDAKHAKHKLLRVSTSLGTLPSQANTASAPLRRSGSVVADSFSRGWKGISTPSERSRAQWGTKFKHPMRILLFKPWTLLALLATTAVMASFEANKTVYYPDGGFVEARPTFTSRLVIPSVFLFVTALILLGLFALRSLGPKVLASVMAIELGLQGLYLWWSARMYHQAQYMGIPFLVTLNANIIADMLAFGFALSLIRAKKAGRFPSFEAAQEKLENRHVWLMLHPPPTTTPVDVNTDNNDNDDCAIADPADDESTTQESSAESSVDASRRRTAATTATPDDEAWAAALGVPSEAQSRAAGLTPPSDSSTTLNDTNEPYEEVFRLGSMRACEIEARLGTDAAFSSARAYPRTSYSAVRAGDSLVPGDEIVAPYKRGHVRLMDSQSTLRKTLLRHAAFGEESPMPSPMPSPRPYRYRDGGGWSSVRGSDDGDEVGHEAEGGEVDSASEDSGDASPERRRERSRGRSRGRSRTRRRDRESIDRESMDVQHAEFL